MSEDKNVYTTGFGAPVENDQNSKTAGNPGPILMQDTHLLEKIGHFAGNAFQSGLSMPRALEHMATSK